MPSNKLSNTVPRPLGTERRNAKVYLPKYCNLILKNTNGVPATCSESQKRTGKPRLLLYLPVRGHRDLPYQPKLRVLTLFREQDFALKANAVTS